VHAATDLASFDPIPPGTPETLLPAETAHAETREDPPFSLVDVVLIVGVAVGAGIFCTLVGLSLFFVIHPSRAVSAKDLATNALFVIPAQIAAYILTVGFMVFLIWHKYRMGLLQAVRWNMPRARLAWLAVAGGAGLGIAGQILSALLARWMPKSTPIEQYFSTPASAYALAAFGILVAPAVEELFFRGFLYPTLARPLGVAPAMALTAGGFALIHSPQLANAWAPLLILFAVGLVLTAVRARFKSVAMCVFIHMGYNFTLFALGFIVTGGFRHMERG
jgi:uncharacterized protein